MSCSACGGALAAPTAASAVETKPTPRPVAPAADDLSTSSFRLATTSIEGHVRMVCETCFSTSATGSAFCLDCGTAFPTKLPGSKTNSARLATKVAVASDADVPTLHCAAGNNFDATPSGESGFTQPGNNVEPKCTEDSRHVDADGETIPTDKAPPVHDASAPTKSVLHSEAIVFGATITLHGCIPSPQQVTNESGSAPPTTPETTMSLPVDFRPLQDVGLGKSKELVLALSHDSDHSSVARFVILPPPGDKTVRIGKTSVHFLQKVVLAILPTDGTSDEPTHSWNNKLSRGLNDFIGSRPRFQTDKSGPTKGELHVKFVLANAPQSTQKLTTGMTNVTIRIADSNRLRTTYSGQDIGYCPAAEANAQALCCGHEKTVFEFAKKVHPMPITFRVDRVVSTVSNQATVAVASDVAVEGAAATIRTIPGTVPDVAMACGHDVCEVGMSTAQASPPLTCPDVLKSVVVD
ncbi:hypothetical protein DYB32_005646 [Aphanomyces invadans]|uniref:Uncharacterized protein n=1 Tax=Aphanomyces invadans TaxID=157072 RepID=A0A418ATZ8_9STRA|nr:hypothetical protein DYB32_005646 [Aphanomyces invadans]